MGGGCVTYFSSILLTELYLGNPERAFLKKTEAELLLETSGRFMQQLALLSDLAPPPFLWFPLLFKSTLPANQSLPDSLLL